jgi:hypothetical protein
MQTTVLWIDWSLAASKEERGIEQSSYYRWLHLFLVLLRFSLFIDLKERGKLSEIERGAETSLIDLGCDVKNMT